MKVLVTGSSGYLGRHFCKALRADNHEVTEINTSNCDLTQQGSLDAFSQEKYDMIFHCCGVYIQAGDFPNASSWRHLDYQSENEYQPSQLLERKSASSLNLFLSEPAARIPSEQTSKKMTT